MSAIEHPDVRITLDDDVAEKLRLEARRSGRRLRAVVNEALRIGLAPPTAEARTRFTVRARDLGGLAPGLTLESIADLLDRVEGPRHR